MSANGIGSMLIEGPLAAEGRAQAGARAAAAAQAAGHAETRDDDPALIGPNAVLQLAHVMEERLGTARTMTIIRKAGLAGLPGDEAMIPEADAIALHHALAMCEPTLAMELVRESGVRTADYIIAHRIPASAVWALRHLPASLAARALMVAIKSHAWTFTGAGQFVPDGPWTFSINRCTARDWAEPPASLFAWYAAVFERLFQQVAAVDCACCDTSCIAGPTTRIHHYRIDRRTAD